jgi:hypothetical protein
MGAPCLSLLFTSSLRSLTCLCHLKFKLSELQRMLK